VLITDGNDGDAVVNFDSNDVRTTLGVSALGNVNTFTGQRFDAETELHYYKNRYYDCRAGRFVSRDAIGIVGGENLYTYSSSSPLLRVDLFGFIDWELGFAVRPWKYDDEDFSAFATQNPTIGDRLQWQAAYDIVNAPGVALISSNGKDALNYYLSKGVTGEKDFDGARVLRQDFGAANDIAPQFLGALDGLRKKRGYHGPFVGHQNTSLGNDQGGHGEATATSWEFHPSLGSFFIRGWGDCICNDDKTRDAIVTIEMSDYYNFHDLKDQRSGILNDSRMRRLHFTGLARNYYRYGGTRTVRFNDFDNIHYTKADVLQTLKNGGFEIWHGGSS